MFSVFGQSYLHLSVCILWFRLFGVSPAYENIALNKPAYQYNPYDKENKTFDASNAVDGLKLDLSWNGGQCAVSASGQQLALWWVNLGSIHLIHHIKLYFRTDNTIWDNTNNVTSTFLGFLLYVSNTTDTLNAKLCFKDDYFNRSTIPAVFSTVCPVQGQYVIYYNDRLRGMSYPSDYSSDAKNDLCEVEVYVLSTDAETNNRNPVPYDVIGGLCALVVIICVMISYYVLTRISMKRLNASQQQSNVMRLAHNDTLNGSKEAVSGIEFTKLGVTYSNEPPFIYRNTAGLV